MRYSYWDGKPTSGGHRLVTTVIHELGLDKESETFNETSNQLYYLRTRNLYLNGITSQNPAPYDTYQAATQPDNGFTVIQDLALTPAAAESKTRRQWCEFYQNGKIEFDTAAASVFKKGDLLRGIGYWDVMIDQLDGEGFAYTSDGNGYSSNVINWNTAVAIQANNEFVPGTDYKTLKTGYSSMFTALFREIEKLAAKKKVRLDYRPNTRLHSILEVDGKVRYTLANRDNPSKKSAEGTSDAAWMAMPPYALSLVAQATQYVDHPGLDVLNHSQVQLYLGAAILQPSYKIGMFFDQAWWLDSATTYPPNLQAWQVTGAVIARLAEKHFPKKYLARMQQDPSYFDQTFTTAADFVVATEACIDDGLSYKDKQKVLAAAERNTIGPTVTDLPIRQVVYFGNNARDPKRPPVYGILASYDDETFTSFWQELELGPGELRKVALSENYQPLVGPRQAPPIMVQMLRQQLAYIHFGPQATYDQVPPPLECAFMDWSLPPFSAGYHAWAPHYDICEVQQKIRKPSQLIGGADANIFIVGEAYSNDQAWVEGAYCTAESVLNDFFGVKPLIDDEEYPFICPCGC